MENTSSDKEKKSAQPKEFELFGHGASKKAAKQSEGLEIVNRILEMHKDLKEKLDYINEKGKECHIDPNLFFRDDHTNFSQADIEKLNEAQRALFNKLEVEPTTIQQPETPMITKSEDKLTKERKSKLRGARNKWIPLQ